MAKEIRNVSASVRARLLQIAKASEQSFDHVLVNSWSFGKCPSMVCCIRFANQRLIGPKEWRRVDGEFKLHYGLNLTFSLHFLAHPAIGA